MTIDIPDTTIVPFDRIVKGGKMYVVWAVEPLSKDMLRTFVRPLKADEK